MTLRMDMELVRPGLVATAACAMVWWFLVQPVHERLASAKADLWEQRATIEQFEQFEMEAGPAVGDELAVWSRRAQDLRRYVRGSADGASVYEEFIALAQEHNVVIKRIDPRQNRRVGTGPRGKDDSNVHVIEFGYKIDLEGGFEQIARFIDAVATQSPLCTVTTVHLTPVVRGKTHLVNATVQTSHYRLDRHLGIELAQEPD